MIVTLAEAAAACGDAALAADAYFAVVCAGIDRQVKNFVRRELEYGVHTEKPAVNGYTDRIYLHEWPIEAIEVNMDEAFTFAPGTVVDATQFYWQPDSGELMWRYGAWPTTPGAVQVTYAGGYWPTSDVNPAHPKMPADIILATLKQIRIEWEREGAVVQAESFGDHSATYVRPFATARLILDDSVRSLLQPHRSYA
jgi:hypothetical protein